MVNITITQLQFNDLICIGSSVCPNLENLLIYVHGFSDMQIKAWE